MKAHLFPVALAGLLVALGTASASADGAKAVDIERAAPADAFLAVYARHNPKRDYQREYFAEAWKTFQDEQIGQRLMDIVTSRMPEDKLATAKSKISGIENSLGADQRPGAAQCGRSRGDGSHEGPFNQTLVAARLQLDRCRRLRAWCGASL